MQCSQAVNKNCDILEEAIQRYTAIIKESAQGYVRAPLTKVEQQIQQIQVNLKNTCKELPDLNMDESCRRQLNFNTWIPFVSLFFFASLWQMLKFLNEFFFLFFVFPFSSNRFHLG